MKEPVKLFGLFLMFVFCTSCGGQNKTDFPKENIKSKINDIVTSTGFNDKYPTKYECTDFMGKRLIIQNSLPRGGTKYTDPKIYLC